MRTIVAGIDLTAMGRRVADRARMVAEASDASLMLVHVLEPVAEAMIDPGLARIMRKHQADEAERIARAVGEKSQVEVTLEVVRGSPSWELVSRSKRASMVVLGSSTVDAFTAGPITSRVARMASCDVLVVRRQPRVPYRRVIAPVDFSPPSRVAVDQALTLFPEAETTLLYSLPSRFDSILSGAGLFREEMDASRVQRLEMAKDKMSEFAAAWDGQVRGLVVDGPPAETIDEMVRRRSADLVVVGSRGAGATRMVLLGTVAEGLLNTAPCDVLIARSRSAFRRP